MTLHAPETAAQSITSAARAAARNFSNNIVMLQNTRPALGDILRDLPDDMEWVYGRDGSLTALNSDGKWWAGCSLPHRAAQFMLKEAVLEGTVLCFLFPLHAAQLRVALDFAKPAQAVLAITPSEKTLHILLACGDFSEDLAAHRLYFATGPAWETQLDQLLTDLPGLPTPTQFIRPILVDPSQADDLIAPAQKMFANHSERRGNQVRLLRESWKPGGLRRICVVAPSLFRLWDDTGGALSAVVDADGCELEIRRFNPDDPAAASSAALALTATGCDAIVTPNIGRADLPDLLPIDMPWATWITSPRIPSGKSTGPRDSILLADASWKSSAMEQGWKADQIFFADWPMARLSWEDRIAPGVFEVATNPYLAIISNTKPLDPPTRVIEYSSHRLLWESIQRELLENPFALNASPEVYLTDRMRRGHLKEDGFDRAAFLDGVILHAWQQGLARLLVHEKLPVKVFGEGWGDIEEFSAIAGGAIRTREELARAVGSASALIHTWPTSFAHPIFATGKPVVPIGSRRNAFVRDAGLALSGKYECTKRSVNVLASQTILRALLAGGNGSR